MKILMFIIACLCLPTFAIADCLSNDSLKPYTGPLFDAMAQIGFSDDTILNKMDDSGVKRMALFPRVHRKEYGVPFVTSLKSRFPDRFVIGTPKWFEMRGDVSDSFISQTISGLRDDKYQFVGEILFVHGDKESGERTITGERYIRGDAPNVFHLMQELQTLHVPVMTHWEVYSWERDWPSFHHLYSTFPDVTFVWPHAGFGSAEQAEIVLSQHRNVMITLSKREKEQSNLRSEEQSEEVDGEILDECGSILPEWRALIDKYPTRFMFATDAHRVFRWAKYVKVVSQWRDILGQLSDSQAKMIGWENADRVYGKPH